MNTSTLRCLRTASHYQHIQIVPKQNNLIYTSRFTLRHASTSTPTTTSSQTANNPKTSLINGPATTLPAPIDLPVRKPDQSFFPTYAFALGKAYITFYKTGVKNIYYNFKASHEIQSRLDSQHHLNLTDAVHANHLTRSEFQLLIRNWHDVKRVPIFGLVLIICGEFTPLVVLAVSSVVPWTCRIPKQINSDRSKLEQRRSISFRNLTVPPPTAPGVQQLQRMQLIHISWSLGLSSSIWDWLGGQYPGLPNFILRGRVRRRIEYLELDDGLIGKAGGIKDMNIEEVRMALGERGVDVLGKDGTQLKALLGAWLRSREKWPVERLLLTRPSVWPVRPSAPEKMPEKLVL